MKKKSCETVDSVFLHSTSDLNLSEEKVVLISSEPLSSFKGHWKEVPPNHLIIINDTRDCSVQMVGVPAKRFRRKVRRWAARARWRILARNGITLSKSSSTDNSILIKSTKGTSTPVNTIIPINTTITTISTNTLTPVTSLSPVIINKTIADNTIIPITKSDNIPNVSSLLNKDIKRRNTLPITDLKENKVKSFELKLTPTQSTVELPDLPTERSSFKTESTDTLIPIHIQYDNIIEISIKLSKKNALIVGAVLVLFLCIIL